MASTRDCRILNVDVQPWTHALESPFIVAQRTAHCAQNVLITITTSAGTAGLGECAPVSYVTGETVESALAALSRAAQGLAGKSVSRLAPLLRDAADMLTGAPAALAGLQMAIYDTWAKHRQMPLWQHFGGAKERLETDLTIPIVSAPTAAAVAVRAQENGFSRFKIKVGDPAGPDLDRERILAVRAAAPDAILRIDANQAFSAPDAVEFVRSLGPARAAIELIEQPVPRDDFAGLRHVKDHLDIPVLADESACSLQAVTELLRDNVVDGINIKLMKFGVCDALAAVSICRAYGKRLMLGCMLESRLGIAAAAHIAAGTGAFDYIDLDSHLLLKDVDSLVGGFESREDSLYVGGEAAGGWGVIHSGPPI
jgi:L-alanine-DL-glutamate epimerase-like enolase superfamily enzyme